MWAAPEGAAKLVEVYAQGRRQFWSWNLAHANLEGGDLMDVDLSGVCLARANLRRTGLERAILAGQI